MGPLQGVKIIELGGIGPGPFAGLLLSDMGAEVVRVDRAESLGRRTGTDRGDVTRPAARWPSTSRTPTASCAC